MKLRRVLLTLGLAGLTVAGCLGGDNPGYEAFFWNASGSDVLVQFESNIGVECIYPVGGSGDCRTLWTIRSGAAGAVSGWVGMDWFDRGLLSSPAPEDVGHIRILTTNCRPIAVFDEHKDSGTPLITIAQDGSATARYVSRGPDDGAPLTGAESACAAGVSPSP